MKDIKDYLHLYLGQQCFVTGVDDDSGYYDLIDGGTIQAYIDEALQSIQPALRPLSDMTDEEMDEVWYGIEPKNVLVMEYSDNRNVRKVALCSERTRYLLSKGFDLFNLIPDGLAIDRTTLKENA